MSSARLTADLERIKAKHCKGKQSTFAALKLERVSAAADCYQLFRTNMSSVTEYFCGSCGQQLFSIKAHKANSSFAGMVIGSAFEAGTFYAGGAYNLMLAEPRKRQRSS